MLTFKTIDEKEMQNIIDTKEISDNIKNDSENVIAIFTQNWCGDWKGLQRELNANEKTCPIDITIYVCLYNESSLYESFMNFKETVWNNDLIPYLRYYKNGSFIKDTNHLPFQRLIKIFG
ncbi:hypothetical protein [uncultured Brachyspira sp.]|uniref:hypothetical protein n=1 Tax=uncultured Brachyspira sp. TaxID=221953 RepID=UPI0025F63356|nr:hypothetical protein [uncultured Brachyspira sp.]